MSPIRIQLSRKKGWRMPPNTVRVCRPTIWGNPWSIRECAETFDLTPNAARQKVIEWYRDWLSRPGGDESMGPLGCYGDTAHQHAYIQKHIHHLRGKNLACFCPLDQPCHADVLLELANRPDGPITEEIVR